MHTLSGLPWHARSPSRFDLAGLEAHAVTIAFDGAAWLIAIDGVWSTREFPTRDAAATLVAAAFTRAREMQA